MPNFLSNVRMITKTNAKPVEVGKNVPPKKLSFSIMATRAPLSNRVKVVVKPASPPPTTTAS
jgi:hypothetical protein